MSVESKGLHAQNCVCRNLACLCTVMINLNGPEYGQPGAIKRKLGKCSQLTHTQRKYKIFLNQKSNTITKLKTR